MKKNKSKSRKVTIVVTKKEYERDLRRGIPPDETLAPGRHVFRRGGFLERHGLKPGDVRKMFKASPPAPPEPISSERVIEIRERLQYSQSMLAQLLGVSPRTVQDWEQGRRVPSGAALKLLIVAEKHPDVLRDL